LAAPEDLNRGKTPAQLFASDCADCHRNPRGLAKRDANSLTAFLRVHYTVSKESAAAIAGYLVSLGADPRPGSSRPSPRTAPAKPSASQEQARPPKEGAQPAVKPSEPATSAEPTPATPSVAAPPPPPAPAAPTSSEPPAANPQ
jgi:hypothetical protein